VHLSLSGAVHERFIKNPGADSAWACGLLRGGNFMPDSESNRYQNSGSSFRTVVARLGARSTSEYRRYRTVINATELLSEIGCRFLQVIAAYHLARFAMAAKPLSRCHPKVGLWSIVVLPLVGRSQYPKMNLR
jgi:hypothetical protein